MKVVTRWIGEIPPSVRSETSAAIEVEEKPKFNTNMPLDKFQTKYTSEDNASFDEILEKDNTERKKRYKWIFDSEKKLLVLENKSTQNFITQGDESSEKPESSVDRRGFVETWNYKVRIFAIFQLKFIIN